MGIGCYSGEPFSEFDFTPPATPEAEKNKVKYVEISNMELVQKEGRTYSEHPLVFQNGVEVHTNKPTISNYSNGELEISKKRSNQRANRHYHRYGHWYVPTETSLMKTANGCGDIGDRAIS